MMLEENEYSIINDDFPHKQYVIKKDFNDSETKTITKITNILKGKGSQDFDNLDLVDELKGIFQTQDILNIFPDKITYENLTKKIEEIVQKLGIKNVKSVAGAIIDQTFGFEIIGTMLRDPNLEEIMINGEKKTIFVIHRKYGMCKTKLYFRESQLENFITKIAKTTGRDFGLANPILDARLSDGSRINATLNTITPFGSTLTIRKFTQKPMSIISLIKNNTISSELAAFLWVCIEGFGLAPRNSLVVGGTGTGKTTLLIALTSFIRYSDRIITIEDTPEINLQDRENWIAMETKAQTTQSPEIDMNMLLKTSLRMRPDRLIVGEVRGKEAETLFTAMDTGHNGILGTVHANNAKETINRLKSSPMEVSESNITLLNLIISIKKQYIQGVGMTRKIFEVAELERMDNSVLISNIYERKTMDDEIKRTGVPTRTLENISDILGTNKSEILEELKVREKMLEWMTENEIYDYLDITKIVQKYYEDPKKVLDEMFK